jgi:hypothetical protein
MEDDTQYFVAEVVGGREAPETRIECDDMNEVGELLAWLAQKEPKKQFVVVVKGPPPPDICPCCKRPL